MGSSPYYPLPITQCANSTSPTANCLANHYQPCWTLKADIAEFFDSLSWPILCSQLEKLPIAPDLKLLIEQHIKTGIVIAHQHIQPTQGVLQGSVLSGALANLYLHSFDQRCLQAGFNLVRYGDDFVIACSSWQEATETLTQVEQWLAQLYLRLQPNKTHIFAHDQEFIFLGYRFVNGEVFAPEPPEVSTHVWVSQSGQPYPGDKPRRKPARLGRPKASGLPKVIQFPQAPVDHLWKETMTTLYVTDQGSYLKAKNYQFQIFNRQQLRIKVPVNRVTHIVLFGCCSLSHGAVKLALSRRIPVLYLSQRGRYFGRLQTDGLANVDYLQRQVLCSQDPEFVQRQAQAIVNAKLHNSRALLLKLNRRRRSEVAKNSIGQMMTLMERLPQAESIDALRGYEGQGASVYFQGLGSLFLGPFTFEKRTKRPPTDPVNSLLSLGYTLLFHNVGSSVQGLGLHTHFGNLHVPRNYHPALVSDLMEEFRAQVVDSLVCYLINSKIFTESDFTPPDDRGGVFLHPTSLRKFLKHWEEKLLSQVTHPHTGYQVTLRRCLELQAREYLAALIEDVDVYRPMIWKL
ncbi:CRISPR-associated endonuclease Cas1 [Roseofilum sp. BLCC_M91]|uniref:CRISPR-associated endonuclease Cas1 n=1 Tax=Roseofilum halophilum BLCC-M91 TaxID=3022259 RepID=A0ABT7BLT6_9CYAN|nr:CRISPR-associated endonuclease Cas1 [Roseofilum halophilum]MDJ1180035.1 CRISPR-associated endonuclease Cas1 [Roseofilum halophilum BLCC-M91]